MQTLRIFPFSSGVSNRSAVSHVKTWLLDLQKYRILAPINTQYTGTVERVILAAYKKPGEFSDQLKVANGTTSTGIKTCTKKNAKSLK